MVQWLQVVVVENPQLRHELLLLLQQVTNHLLPVVDVLGYDLLLYLPPGLSASLLPRPAHRLLHIVGGEPASAAVKRSLPPAALLLLCDCDRVALLELQLV